MSGIDGGNAFSEWDAPYLAGSFAPPTRKVQDVIQFAQRQFGDESGVQLQDSDVIRWINDAQNEIVTRNRTLKAKSTALSVPGQSKYTFPSVGILQIEGLDYAGKPLRAVPFEEAREHILRHDPQGTVSGTPELWFAWAGELSLWPTPASVGDITIYFTAKPKDVTAPTDTLILPDKYFESICRYVMQQAYEMDDNWQAVATKQQQFDAGVNDIGEEERTAENMTYSAIQPTYGVRDMGW